MYDGYGGKEDSPNRVVSLQISSFPMLGRFSFMDSMFLNVILVFIGSVIGSIGSSSIVLYLIKRRDKISDLVIHNNRLAEGMVLQSECLVTIIDALHDKQIINGDGQDMKKRINEYLMRNTAKGYSIDEEK